MIFMIEIPELVEINTKSCYVVVFFPYMYSVLYMVKNRNSEICKYMYLNQ